MRQKINSRDIKNKSKKKRFCFSIFSTVKVKKLFAWLNNKSKEEVILFEKNTVNISFKPFFALQGAAILLLFIFVASFFIPKEQIKSEQVSVIKSAVTKKISNIVASGKPVEWTKLVRLSDIQSGKSVLNLPKDARNIKIRKVSLNQANNIIQSSQKEALSLSQRQQLALANQPKSFLAASLLDSISKYFLSSIEDGVQAITDLVNPDITATPDATVVDLSGQTAAPIETSPVETPAKTSPAPAETPVVTPAPSETVPETPAPAESVPSEISPTTETPAPAETPVESPEANPSSTSEPTVTGQTSTGTGLDDATVKDTNYVAVDYTTSAPQITEETTDTGKQVTVSAVNEDPQTPLVDVLASTKIPEIYKVGQEDKIHIKWKNNGNQDVAFHAYDTNNNGKLDYVEWTVAHLSDQVFDIIFISKAFQLDADKNIIGDIYDQTKAKDGNWASLTDGQYVRVTFNKLLNNTNDNTIYAKPTDPTKAVTIESYPVYTDAEGNMVEGTKVDTFQTIDHEGTYKILLSNLVTQTDVFDLKITGNVDIDFIVDPGDYIFTGSGYWDSNIYSDYNAAGTFGGQPYYSNANGYSIWYNSDENCWIVDPSGWMGMPCGYADYSRSGAIIAGDYSGYWGPGNVAAGASAATITLSTATGVTKDTVTLNGNITANGGVDPTVTMYWGTADGGTTPGSWAHSSAPDSPSSQPQGVAAFSINLTGLTAGTTYYFSAKSVNANGTSWPAASLSFTTNPAACNSSGGTVTLVDNYCIHKFTSSGTFVAANDLTAKLLVVGGGGGGGGTVGAGGGAGGLIYSSSRAISTGSVSVTVGAGGVGGKGWANHPGNGAQGSNSSFGDLVAIGGGGGNNLSDAGTSGGSGSGIAGGNAVTSGLQPTSTSGGYGNDGGGSSSADPYAGGGGGAGAVGGAGGVGSRAGNGGDGLVYGISGTPTWYAGGGGGGMRGGTGGTGGLGGGGDGTGTSVKAGDGVAGTGGGGGGAGYDGGSSSILGGTGGSGVVIVSYFVGTVAAPTVTLSDASFIDSVSARINGNITATGGDDPTVTMYWGATDGGTIPGSWDHNSAPTAPSSQPQGIEAFYEDISGLTPGTTYYFSAKATNSAGTSWPAASYSFRASNTPVFDSYTKLLLHANGSGTTVVDSSASGHSIAVGGNATQSSTQWVFGRKSLYLPDINGHLDIEDSLADFNWGTNDAATIDFRVRFSSTGGGQWFYCDYGNDSNDLYMSGNKIYMRTNTSGGGTAIWPWAPSTNTWYHFALVKDTSGACGVKIFINGIQLTRLSCDLSTGLSINGGGINLFRRGSNEGLNGYIDEFRWSKGVARWTSNFTPPAVEFPTTPKISLGNSTNATTTSFRINGNIVDNGGSDDSTVTVYWGATDGGTNSGNWAHSSAPTDPSSQPQGVGAFYKDISGLSLGTKYYFSAKATNSMGTSWPSASSSFYTNIDTANCTATGGTITSGNGKCVHTFTSSGTFNVPSGVTNVEALVIGGGGGGGLNWSGGGGAGGLIYNNSYAVSSGDHDVVVGDGGAGGTSSSGTNGGNSSFGSLTAIGGGGGGGGSSGGGNGSIGGSGGGGQVVSGNGAAGTSGQGYAGGSALGAWSAPYYRAGGGGGAGGNGSNGGSSGGSGNGGAGLSYSINGLNICYAGGGGGGGDSDSSNAVAPGLATCGGGNGVDGNAQTGTAGVANTGGGGGGAGGNNGVGGAGGSGVVILSYTPVGGGEPPAPTAPTVTVSAASSVAKTTATINGNVTDTGGENPTVTTYWGTSDGGTTVGSWANNSAPTNPSSQPQGAVAFSKNLTGLTPLTRYYFSAKANNSAGTSWPSASLYFDTDPCTQNSDCTVLGYCNTYAGACTNGTLGSGCGADAGCNNFYCASNHTCGGVGATCASGAQCVSTYCNVHASVCTTGADGQGCGNNADCTSNHCGKNFICTSDSTPPTQSAWSPANSSVLSTSTPTITLTLSENGDCKSSLTDQAYADMTTDCGNDGTTSISCTTANLGSNGAKTVYIACEDVYGNGDTIDTNTALSYTLTVVTAPSITTSAATDVMGTTATLSGNVTATGAQNPTVTVYWGTTDGGTTPGSWANSSVPTSPSQPQGAVAFSKNLTGLTPLTRYYFSAKATNSAGTSWPSASLYFDTDVCTLNSDCTSGYCNTYAGACTNGTLGSGCGADAGCNNFYCASNHTCGGVGATCASGAQCVSTYCNIHAGVCTTGADGQGCGNNADCTSNNCGINNICTSDSTPSIATGVTSSLSNGSYTVGQVIPIQVSFNENVYVTGTPQITLSTGSPSTTAVNYTSGSGTSTLTFNYTVVAGNTSAGLDYSSTSALALNGGTIKDAANNNATLTLASPGATNSLGANKALVIDTTAPTITINNPGPTAAQSKTITASKSDGTLTMSNTTGSTCDGTLTFVAYASQIFTSESDNGTKVCYKAVDALGNTAYSMSNAITGIDATKPTQSNWSPADGATITTNTPEITLNTSEKGDCLAVVGSDLGYDAMAATTHIDCLEDVETGRTHTCSMTSLGADGTKNIYISCEDYPALNKDTANTNKNLTYTLDTTPPVPSNFNPADSATIADQTPTITFDLNENGNCRAATSDKSYDNMVGDTVCSGSGTSMSCSMSSLGANGSKTIYFSCVDSFGNKDTISSNHSVTYTLAREGGGAPNGSSCTHNTDCSSGYCNNGSCVGDIGDACTGASDCHSTYCNTHSHVCATGLLGAGCGGNNECNGYYCSSYVCGGTGAQCATGSDCSSGHCYDGICQSYNCTAENDCNGHGSCTGQDTCSCSTNYYGASCSTNCVASTTCNSHGTCNINGACSCGTGWTGASCNSCATNYYGPSCNYCLAGTTCSGNGTCSSSGGGACNCSTGYIGASCSSYDNAYWCNSHGTYSGNSCSCSAGWAGLDCSKIATGYNDCTSSGQCQSNFCNSNGYCTDKSLSSNCGASDDCTSTYCNTHNHVCATGALGSSCGVGADCLSGLCDSYKCTNNIDGACTQGSDCHSTYCNTHSHVCATGLLGAGCGDSSECNGYHCGSNTCGGIGAVCAVNSDCHNNHCGAGLTCTAPVVTINDPNTYAAQSKTITASADIGTLTMSNTTGSTSCTGDLTFVTYASQTFTSESDNGKKVCYRAVDSDGNASYWMSNAISGIDIIAPVITINNPTLSPATSKTITASTNEGTLTMSNVTGSTPCTGSLTFITYASQTFTSESDNGKKVCYKAVDSANNITYSTSDAITGIDRTAPVITINNPNPNPAQSKTVTSSINDGTITMSNTTGSTCDGTLTFITYASQTFTSEADNGKKVCYRAVDAVGNTAYNASSAVAGIDVTAPTTSDNFTNNNTWESTSQTITLIPVDALSGIAWTKYCTDTANTCDPATGMAYTTPVAISTEDTSYFRYASQDAAGNTQTTVSKTVKIDTTSPTTTASAGSYTFGTTSSGNVTVSLSCADGGGAGCSITFYCTDALDTCTPTTAYTVPFVVLTSGTSYIRYLSTDLVSHSETAKTQTIKIEVPTPTPETPVNAGNEGGNSYIPTSNSSTQPNIISQIAQQIGNVGQNVSNVLIPSNSQPQINYPPIAQSVPVETPIVFQGGNIISKKQFDAINILPLPEAIKDLAFKFPKFASTLEAIDVSKPSNIESLKVTQLTFLSLSEVASVPSNLPIAKFTDAQRQNIPSNIAFARTGDDNIDLNIKVSVSDLNKPIQSISTIQNKPLYLTIKPDNPASSVKGYVIFKSANSQAAIIEKTNMGLSASLLDATNILEKSDATKNNPAVIAKKDVVLSEFDYIKNGDIWTAQIDAPEVSGQYEVRTTINYKEKTKENKLSENVSMVLVVDPEGYVYEKALNNQETRIKNAKVSIYWLNPKTLQYELWPAKEFQQTNPQTTDITGKYSFLVPTGTYYLQVESQDYVTYKGKAFQIEEGKGIHENIELKAKNWFARLFTIDRAMLGVVIILLLAIFTTLIYKKRKS